MPLFSQHIWTALIIISFWGCASNYEPSTVYPPDLSVYSISPSSLRLEWNAVEDDNGQITSYRIGRRSGQSDEFFRFASGTFFVDTGLVSTSEYEYTVEPISNSNPTQKSLPIRVRFGPSYSKRFEIPCYWSAAYSSSLRRVAIFHKYDDTKFYHTDTGQYLLSVPTTGEQGDFHPNGSALAVSQYSSGYSLSTITVIRPSDGAVLFVVSGHEYDSRNYSAPLVQYSPDGNTIITASRKPSLLYWNSSTGAKMVTVNDSGPRIKKMALSPDGQWIATASDWTIKLRRFSDGVVVHHLMYHANDISAIAFSSDSKHLASSEELSGEVIVWKVSDGTMVQSIPSSFAGGYGGVTAIAFGSDSSVLFIGNSAGGISLWNWQSNRTLFSWKGNSGNVQELIPDRSDSLLFSTGYSAFSCWRRSTAGAWYIIN